jgi:hypothetical protein
MPCGGEGGTCGTNCVRSPKLGPGPLLAESFMSTICVLSEAFETTCVFSAALGALDTACVRSSPPVAWVAWVGCAGSLGRSVVHLNGGGKASCPRFTGGAP